MYRKDIEAGTTLKLGSIRRDRTSILHGVGGDYHEPDRAASLKKNNLHFRSVDCIRNKDAGVAGGT